MNKYLINKSESEYESESESEYEGLTTEDLQKYSIRVLSLPYLLENWFFPDYLTSYFFINGINDNSLKTLVLEDELLSEHFDIVDEKVYYFIMNNGNSELLNYSSISYPNFIAAVVYHFLIIKKNESNEYFAISLYNNRLLEYLFNPLYHNEVLNILKKDIFLSSEFLSSFLREIKYNEGYLFFRHLFKKTDAKHFYNVLRYVGISRNEALTLIKNYNTTGDLNKIKLYLENFQNK